MSLWGRATAAIRAAFGTARNALSLPDLGSGAWSFYGSYGNTETIEPTFEAYARDLYAGNAVVFGLIRTRIALFSEATFKFRRLSDKRLFGDAGLAVLEKPWPGGSTAELLARMEQDASLAGNAYVRNCGDWLERLRPDWVTIVSLVETDPKGHTRRKVVGYLYEPHDADRPDVEFYLTDEVAHWSPIPDPLANWRGMSWLTPVLREIKADRAMTEHREAFYRNAATPNLILKYKTKLQKEQVERISAQINARHGGPANAFRTMVLDEGADPMVVGSVLDDDGAMIQAAGENRIAVASGVPAIVAGLKEGLSAATLANYSEAVRSMADLLIRPNWRGACAALAILVKVPAGAQLWFDTGDIAALQEGEQDQAATLQTKAATASSLINAGYTPESVVSAIEAGDMTLLEHTGLYSVQLQPPGSKDPAPPADPAAGGAGGASEPAPGQPGTDAGGQQDGTETT
ncbi:phage portal protein [Dactylosporangium sp. NPDC000555]|uniref:phage portal protein n=1 Tax=Dactylosporangium sp. NPDC000555 TaxID=3154260 RepID=UPI0033198C61